MEPITRQFGRHTLSLEAPDLVFVRLDGTIDADLLNGVVEWQRSWDTSNGHYFVLCDVTSIGAVPPDTRHLFQNFPLNEYVTTTACFGAGFTVRVIIDMRARAQRLLGRQPAGSQIHFFANEAQARAFLEEARKARAAM